MELPGEVLRNAANRAANRPVNVRVTCVGLPPGDRGANVTRRPSLVALPPPPPPPTAKDDDDDDESRSPVLPLAAREL